MLTAHRSVQFIELTVALVEGPLSATKANMDDVEYDLIAFFIEDSFVFRQFDP